MSARFLGDGRSETPYPSVFVLDPVGKTRYYNGSYLPYVQGVTDLIQAIDENRLPVQMVPGLNPEKDLEYALRYALAEGGTERHPEGFTVIIEETAFWCGENPSAAPPWVALASRLGRHSGVSLIYTGQRPVTIPRVLTSQATYMVISGPLIDPGDFRYTAEFAGPEFAKAALVNPDGAYLVSNLARREIWREDLAGNTSPVHEIAPPAIAPAVPGNPEPEGSNPPISE